MEITFNGKALSSYIDGITTIDRGIGSGWTNTLQDQPFQGADFIYQKTNSKKITVDFLIYGSQDVIAQRRRQLAAVLDTGKPSPLIFSDEPNLCYQAVVDGDQSIEWDFKKATGTITFLVPSGIAESTLEASIKSGVSGNYGSVVNNSDGSVTTNLINNGSVDAFPLITIKNTAENGYVGIVSENGVLEIGNKQEVDGATQTKSETFLSAHAQADFGALKKSTMTGSPQPVPVITNGTLAWQTDGIRLTNSGTGNTTWHGGALEYDIPADSNKHVGAASFYSSFQLYCSAKSYQLGIFQLWFCNANNLPICGYEVMKNVQTNTQAHSKFWVGNGKDNNVSLFKQNDFDINNNQMFTSGTGWADVTKEGADISFYWYGSKYKVNVPAVASMECCKVYVVMGQWQYANNTVDHLMDNLSLKAFTFSKTNEAYYRDVPNRYAVGDTLTIDTGSGKIFHNGIAANDQLVVGSEFFGIPPNSSTLEFYFSTFMKTAPTLEIDWKERYL